LDTRWQVAADAANWLAKALAVVGVVEAEALASRGVFHVVLAGGGTPKRLYESLARESHDWARWQVWYGDERCLPAEHPERNSRMAQEVWLSRVAMPAANIHAIPAELGATVAAEVYSGMLAGMGEFDLVLLGLGEDGHTASLFPGHDWGEGVDAPDALAVFAAPKPPPERVSLSAQRLSRARRVLFLVTGAGKQPAMAAWRRGERLPAAAVQPEAGVDVFMDRDAVPQGE
jgi:6-phosphogluconolactonase